MEIDYNNIFKYTTFALKLNQCHPDIPKNKKWFLKFSITHGLYSLQFLIIIYNIYHDIGANDLSKTCKDCALAVTYTVVTFNYWVMLSKQHLLKDIFETMRNDLKLANLLTRESQDVVLNHAEHGEWVNKTWFFFTLSGSALFVVKNVFLNIYSCTSEDFTFLPIYEFVYPAFIDDLKHNLPVYFILYTFFLYFMIYSAVMYTSFVALCPTFILHTCGKLEVLIQRLDNLFAEENQQVEAEITSVVVQLQQIYGFVDNTKDTFRAGYELILKSSILTTPVCAYSLKYAFGQGEINYEFILVMVASFSVSGFICYYSEMLIQKNEKFRQAVYSCGWERFYDRRARSSISLILLRALRPVSIRTMFSTVCLAALSEIIKQSYTIFNLMNAMWE